MVAERRAVGAHRDRPLAIDDPVADRCGPVGASGLAHLVALALCAADREDRAHALDQRVVERAEPRVAGVAFVKRRHPLIAERLGQRMRDVAKRTGFGLAAEPATPLRAQRDARLAQTALDHGDNRIVRAVERRIRGHGQDHSPSSSMSWQRRRIGRGVATAIWVLHASGSRGERPRPRGSPSRLWRSPARTAPTRAGCGHAAC